MQDIEVDISTTPFPHAIFRNFYNNRELDLIWEELNFYTKPNKLLDAKEYMGVVGLTNARAIILDDVYENHRFISNILTVNRKIFYEETLEVFSILMFKSKETCDCISTISIIIIRILNGNFIYTMLYPTRKYD